MKDEPIGTPPKKTEFWLVLFTAQRSSPSESAGLPHHDASTLFNIIIKYFLQIFIIAVGQRSRWRKAHIQSQWWVWLLKTGRTLEKTWGDCTLLARRRAKSGTATCRVLTWPARRKGTWLPRKSLQVNLPANRENQRVRQPPPKCLQRESYCSLFG